MSTGKRTRVSWEDAVRWYRNQSGNGDAIRANYFDLPVKGAAERFRQGEEFDEIRRILGPGRGRRILDFGAGNGIAALAFAHDGWQTVALEPDISDEVGAGAIESVATELRLSIEIIRSPNLPIPAERGSFDAIHARQVMHHVPDVTATAREFARLLRPGGSLLVTREHVADGWIQRWRFLRGHPLHRFYGGENAYPLQTYRRAFSAAGLRLIRQWGPIESIINFYPRLESERQRVIETALDRQILGLGRVLKRSDSLTRALVARAVAKDKSPGRLYSFLLTKD